MEILNMKRTDHLLLALSTIFILSVLVIFTSVSAQPVVELVKEPDVQEIFIGPEIQAIKIIAKVDRTDVQFKWTLEGSGELKGDLTSPGIFYIAPKEIKKFPEIINVTVTVFDKEGKESLSQVVFTLSPLKVQIKEGVKEPCEGWQDVEYGEVGTVKKTNFQGKYLIIDFPSKPDWIGCPEDLKIVEE